MKYNKSDLQCPRYPMMQQRSHVCAFCHCHGMQYTVFLYNTANGFLREGLLFYTLQGDEFGSSSSLLSGSAARLSKMINSGRSNRKVMCYLIAGLVGLFIVGYYALSKVIIKQQKAKRIMSSCGFLLFFVKHHAEDLMSLCSKFKILARENIVFLEKLFSRNAILQCAMYIIQASLFCLIICWCISKPPG